MRKVVNDVVKIYYIFQVHFQQLLGHYESLPLVENVDLCSIKNSFFLPLHRVQLCVEAVSEQLDFGLEGLLDVAVSAGAVVVVFGLVE